MIEAPYFFMDLGDALRQELEKQSFPYDQSLQGLLAQDQDGILVYYGGAAQDIFGYTGAEAIGMPSSKLVPRSASGEEYARRRQEMFDRVLNTGQAELMPVTERVTKSGETVRISAVVFSYSFNGRASIAALVEPI